MSAGTVLVSGTTVLDFPEGVQCTWRIREGVDGRFVMTIERENVVSIFPLSPRIARNLLGAMRVLAHVPAAIDATEPLGMIAAELRAQS